MKTKDLTGQRFGRLVVMKRLPRYKNTGKTYYRCKCDCGNIKVILYGNLGRGSNSCGCLKLEVLRKRKMPDETIRINAMRRYYKRNSKLRTPVSWKLTHIEFENLVKKPCFYCGYFDSKKFSGIDRKDNSKGYTLGNSVPCCKWCNCGKNERTIAEFKNWVERLHEHLLVY